MILDTSTLHRLKVPASKPVPANLSPVDGPPSLPSVSLSDLDIPITFRNGKRSCTDYEFRFL